MLATHYFKKLQYHKCFQMNLFRLESIILKEKGEILRMRKLAVITGCSDSLKENEWKGSLIKDNSLSISYYASIYKELRVKLAQLCSTLCDPFATG